MSSRSPRRWAALASVALLSVVFSVCAASPDPARAATDSGADRGSSRTLKGRGDFAGLEVTVSQTANLVNQSVTVSWAGGKATPAGNFSSNFLHLMQCWGDDSSGPDRTQCQFGGFTGTFKDKGLLNQEMLARKIRTKAPGTFYCNETPLPACSTYKPNALTDPLEELVAATESDKLQGEATVPFWSVKVPASQASTDPSVIKSAFDRFTTNELYARTRADGTGTEQFEVHTEREASGLGCGAPKPDGSTRHCWFVVVPRGTTEVDGSQRNASGVMSSPSDWLMSSALSASNWADRLVFPLNFEPLQTPCPLGRAERPTTGSESVKDAVNRWQPALCAGDGSAVYGFTEVPSHSARRKVSSASPGLTFLSVPVPADQLGAQTKPSYAPIALTGLGITFNVQRRTGPTRSAQVKLRDGVRETELNLTPRLVAKLVTQSYRRAIPGFNRPGLGGHIADNPENLIADPEFLRYNPQYADYQTDFMYDLLVPGGDSDAAARFWQWLDSDAEAKAFLAGVPDSSGMVVNPHYKGMDLALQKFPKLDPTASPQPDDPFPGSGSGEPFKPVPAMTTQDYRPYASDLHGGAKEALRGNNLTGEWVPRTQETPGRYKAAAAPPNGERAVLAFTDTAAAMRFGLPLARLRNAAGEFVGPTDSGLLAGLAGMAPSGVPGVLAADPLLGDPAAYPLTELVYAATDAARLEPAASVDYAKFLRYAVVSGQIPGEGAGTLPHGYVPLPQALRDQTLNVAELLFQPRTASASPTPASSSSSPSASSSARASATDSASVTAPASPTPSVAPRPVGAPSPSAGATATPSAGVTVESVAPSSVASSPKPTVTSAAPSGTASATSSGVAPIRSSSGSGSFGGSSGSGSGFGGNLPGGSRGGFPTSNNNTPPAGPVSTAKPSVSPNAFAPLPRASLTKNAQVASPPPVVEFPPSSDPALIEPTQRAASRTANDPLGPERYALVALLALGLVAAVSAGSAPIAALVSPYTAPYARKIGASVAPMRARATAKAAPLLAKLSRRPPQP